jgi:hypothetical protein
LVAGGVKTKMSDQKQSFYLTKEEVINDWTRSRDIIGSLKSDWFRENKQNKMIGSEAVHIPDCKEKNPPFPLSPHHLTRCMAAE